MLTPQEHSRIVTFVQPLIGIPYKSGAEGPDYYDCWGIVRIVEKELFNRDVPSIKPPGEGIRQLIQFVRDHPERMNWRVVDKPAHGGVVEMTHAERPFHVGVWLDIDGGGVLHCPSTGVSFDPIVALTATFWRKFTYYDWNG